MRKNTIPAHIARLLPAAQYEHIVQHFSLYKDEIDRLDKIVSTIPRLGDTKTQAAKGGHPTAYLHYFTGTADFFICEYDGEDTFFGTARFSLYHPNRTKYQKISLSNLKSNVFIELDLLWGRQ
jgi:hypothetical protein